MKKYIKSSYEDDTVLPLFKKLAGKDKWIRVEAPIESDEDSGIRGEEWLYFLRILSVGKNGECKVNYFNYDNPEQFSGLDAVGTAFTEDIDLWLEDGEEPYIVSTAEMKKIIKQREEEHDQELRDYYEDDEDDEDEIEGCNVIASEDTNREFKAVPLKSLKKGAWFTIKPIAAPTDKQVYIKDDYDREEKKFMCGRCDDISYSTYFKGDKLVYDDNNFEY